VKFSVMVDCKYTYTFHTEFLWKFGNMVTAWSIWHVCSLSSYETICWSLNCTGKRLGRPYSGLRVFTWCGKPGKLRLSGM